MQAVNALSVLAAVIAGSTQPSVTCRSLAMPLNARRTHPWTRPTSVTCSDEAKTAWRCILRVDDEDSNEVNFYCKLHVPFYCKIQPSTLFLPVQLFLHVRVVHYPNTWICMWWMSYKSCYIPSCHCSGRTVGCECLCHCLTHVLLSSYQCQLRAIITCCHCPGCNKWSTAGRCWYAVIFTILLLCLSYAYLCVAGLWQY